MSKTHTNFLHLPLVLPYDLKINVLNVSYVVGLEVSLFRYNINN